MPTRPGVKPRSATALRIQDSAKDALHRLAPATKIARYGSIRVPKGRPSCGAEYRSGDDRGSPRGGPCAAPPAGGLNQVPPTRAAALAQRPLQRLGIGEPFGRVLGQAP